MKPHLHGRSSHCLSSREHTEGRPGHGPWKKAGLHGPLNGCSRDPLEEGFSEKDLQVGSEQS